MAFDPNGPPQPPQDMVVPPPEKKSPFRLVLLSMLAISLIVALVAGGFLLFAHQSHQTVNAPPVLYASSLTKTQQSWQCVFGAYCQFEANGLHIQAPTDHLYFSELSDQQFNDQVIDVQASLDDGDPQFVGVVIAFRSVAVDGYGFLVYAHGEYEFVRWDPVGNVTILVPLTTTAAIHTGLNQTNELKIIAKGDLITLFINGVQLTQINDSTFSTGHLLLGAARYAADAVFSHLSVTQP